MRYNDYRAWPLEKLKRGIQHSLAESKRDAAATAKHTRWNRSKTAPLHWPWKAWPQGNLWYQAWSRREARQRKERSQMRRQLKKLSERTNSRRPRIRRRRSRWKPYPNPRRPRRLRHFHWNPDAAVMKAALEGYHARGVKVFLGDPGMEVRATIEDQLTGQQTALFKIRFDQPIDPEDYEAAMGMLEGKAGAIWKQARAEGRLDSQGRLKSLTTLWSYLTLNTRAAKRGTLVEYQTMDPRFAGTGARMDTPGRIVGQEHAVTNAGQDVIFMELFEPLALWQLPPGLATAKVKPGFYSKTAYFMGSKSYDALKRRYPARAKKLGPVKKIDTEGPFGTVYSLQDPQPSERVRKLLQGVEDTGYTESAFMALWFIMPIYTGGPGVFRPMREDLARGLETEVWEGAEWLEGLS